MPRSRSEEQLQGRYNYSNVYCSSQLPTTDRHHIWSSTPNSDPNQGARTENLSRPDSVHVGKYILKHQTAQTVTRKTESELRSL